VKLSRSRLSESSPRLFSIVLQYPGEGPLGEEMDLGVGLLLQATDYGGGEHDVSDGRKADDEDP
jgi:hypothetical protein